MQVTDLKLPVLFVVPIIVVTLGFEARYGKQSNIDALQAEIAALKLEIDRGHERSKLDAIIYGINKGIADLTGRDSLYFALEQAGVITEGQRSRWTETKITLANEIRDSERKQIERDALK